MDLATTLNSLGLGKYAPLVLAIVGLASVLASFLPQAKPGTWYAPIRTGLDWIALNVGHAKNAPPAA